MRSRRTRTYNLLINENPADTMDYCAAALNFVKSSQYLDGCSKYCSDHDNYEFGRYLVLQAVRDALLFEATRVTAAERPPKVRKKPRIGKQGSDLAAGDMKH